MSRRKLMSQGAEAQAVVLSSDSVNESIAIRDWRMRLRVHYPDGTQAEATRTEASADIGNPSPGDVFPVRYDPSVPARVEIDLSRVRAGREAALRELDDEAVARAEEGLS
jgi:hypothetical protein